MSNEIRRAQTPKRSWPRSIGDAAAQTWRVSAAELIPELERVGFDDCDTRSAVFRRQAGEPAIPRG
jgi:hypothetical protein